MEKKQLVTLLQRLVDSRLTLLFGDQYLCAHTINRFAVSSLINPMLSPNFDGQLIIERKTKLSLDNIPVVELFGFSVQKQKIEKINKHALDIFINSSENNIYRLVDVKIPKTKDKELSIIGSIYVL